MKENLKIIKKTEKVVINMQVEICKILNEIRYFRYEGEWKDDH